MDESFIYKAWFLLHSLVYCSLNQVSYEGAKWMTLVHAFNS